MIRFGEEQRGELDILDEVTKDVIDYEEYFSRVFDFSLGDCKELRKI